MLFSVDQPLIKNQILNTKQFITDLVQITLHFYICKNTVCYFQSPNDSVLERIWIKGSYLSQWLPQGSEVSIFFCIFKFFSSLAV